MIVDDKAVVDEVYETERHLLFVRYARAKDRLLVTCAAFVSKFLLISMRMEVVE